MAAGKMPYNPINTQPSEAEDPREALAKREAMTLEEWSKTNLPAEKITFRWRYANATIQLCERRLRSLAQFNVGPAICAWARTRLEWMRDERLHAQPDGVLVFSVDPEGDIDIQMEPNGRAPAFTQAQLSCDGGKLLGCELDGSVWVVQGENAWVAPVQIRHAADTFTRDLIQAFGLGLCEDTCPVEVLEDAEIFFINDEFGCIPCQGKTGRVCEKVVACFERLWEQTR